MLFHVVFKISDDTEKSGVFYDTYQNFTCAYVIFSLKLPGLLKVYTYK